MHIKAQISIPHNALETWRVSVHFFIILNNCGFKTDNLFLPEIVAYC